MARRGHTSFNCAATNGSPAKHQTAHRRSALQRESWVFCLLIWQLVISTSKENISKLRVKRKSPLLELSDILFQNFSPQRQSRIKDRSASRKSLCISEADIAKAQILTHPTVHPSSVEVRPVHGTFRSSVSATKVRAEAFHE
uniref:Uncharacterized protein n=1 Tax=Coccidioides posadasii RMSCC 3488 TaxID=454284 RepID=A0A0J6F724_COCPO|nr:hypothetical protein CPAG_01086 [Coccidioides posadasii RMSCC 3488]